MPTSGIIDAEKSDLFDVLAVDDLGRPDAIGWVFSGFQKHL
ncbi:hypothetical protein [Thiocystis violacea]|nr:hypothetical protein [Thiocystis violacea]